MAKNPAESPELIGIRLYEWALGDAEREVRAKFPFVGRIKGGNAAKYLRFFSQLDLGESRVASSALVKRMNQPVLLGRKPILRAEEDIWVRRYLQFEEVLGPGGLRMIVADPEESGVVQTREMRKALRGLIQERFHADFGSSERVSANEWLYEVPVGPIRIRTRLDVGGRSSLNYSHKVLQPDGTSLDADLSVLQWLGAASMTRWRVLRVDEIVDAADTVFALSKHFVAEMRKLFS